MQQLERVGVVGCGLMGSGIAEVLARAGVQALLRTYPESLPRAAGVAVDTRVLLFTLGVSMATGVIFGLAPVLHIRMKELITALKEGGARGATRNHRRPTMC